jgi:hypothetical protein
MDIYTGRRNRGPPTSGADEATGGEGKPAKSPPEALVALESPFFLQMENESRL